MSDLEKTRADYERVYGTRPAEALMMLPRPSRHSGYQGCRIENSKIVFEFSTPKQLDDVYDLVEMQFRNRLSRKISFEGNKGTIRIFISDYAEERGEYLTAAMDLDNYFRGQEADIRLKAEHSLCRRGENWRNPELVAQEIKKMMESKR